MNIRKAIPVALLAVIALTACDPTDIAVRVESITGAASIPAKAKRNPVPQCCQTLTSFGPNAPAVDPNASGPRPAP